MSQCDSNVHLLPTSSDLAKFFWEALLVPLVLKASPRAASTPASGCGSRSGCAATGAIARVVGSAFEVAALSPLALALLLHEEQRLPIALFE